MRYISNHTSAPVFIAQLLEFDGNSMSARKHATPYQTGRMPIYWADLFRMQANAGQIEYVVFSWNTPIAWLAVGTAGDKRWFAPSYTYSGYSSRHQSLASVGIHKWCDLNDRLCRDPETIVRADEFYTTAEIIERTASNRAMACHRKQHTGTIRIVKPGYWMLNKSGRYGQVYGKDKSANGNWYAIVGNGGGVDKVAIVNPDNVTVLK